MSLYSGSNYREKFSTRLAEALKQRGMRQIDLCNATGIGRSAISQYLSGFNEPKQDYIFKIATALKVSEAWLMGFDVEMDSQPHTSRSNEDFYLKEMMNEISKQDPRLAKLIDSYMNLNDKGKELLSDYAEKLLTNGVKNHSKN